MNLQEQQRRRVQANIAKSFSMREEDLATNAKYLSTDDSQADRVRGTIMKAYGKDKPKEEEQPHKPKPNKANKKFSGKILSEEGKKCLQECIDGSKSKKKGKAKKKEEPKKDLVRKAFGEDYDKLVEAFGSDFIEKARGGIYQDTPENRKLGRVGQKYGGQKKEDEPKGKPQGQQQQQQPQGGQKPQEGGDKDKFKTYDESKKETQAKKDAGQQAYGKGGAGKESKPEPQEAAADWSEHGIDAKTTAAIEEAAGATIESVDDYGNGLTLTMDDGSEYSYFGSYEEAEEAATEYLDQMYDEMGVEAFSPEFAEQYTTISPTDMRMLADDLSESDRDWISEETDDEDEIEEQVEARYEEHMEGLKNDARGYLVDELGIYSDEDFSQQSFVSVDTESMFQDAIDVDGVAHFLAGYDGEEHEVGDGFMYRTN